MEVARRLSLGEEIVSTIRGALAEDIGSGDVTTDSMVGLEANARAKIVSKQSAVVSGLSVAQALFLMLDPDVRLSANVSDGTRVESGQRLIEINRSARAILTGERTALNFLGRMSGIATLTNQFVRAIAETGAEILDARKTAPGLRAIDKLAVRHGGGRNHRFGLYDMVLIKDNHIDCAGSIGEAIRRVRASDNQLEIEIEVKTIKELQEALDLSPLTISVPAPTFRFRNSGLRARQRTRSCRCSSACHKRPPT